MTAGADWRSVLKGFPTYRWGRFQPFQHTREEVEEAGYPYMVDSKQSALSNFDIVCRMAEAGVTLSGQWTIVTFGGGHPQRGNCYVAFEKETDATVFRMFQ